MHNPYREWGKHDGATRLDEGMFAVHELIAFVEDALAPVGGRLFAGYSAGKDEEKGDEAAGPGTGQQ